MLRLAAGALGLVFASVAAAQPAASAAPLPPAPFWGDTLALAPMRLGITAWPWGVLVRTLDVDPDIATFEGDSTLARWVTAGFEFFDALADGATTPPFGWSDVPADSTRGKPQGLRLGYFPDPARGGALQLGLAVYREAVGRGVVVPLSVTEASRVLGTLGEAASRVRTRRDSIVAVEGPPCEDTALLASRGPRYPASLVKSGIGGELHVVFDLRRDGLVAEGTFDVMWASDDRFVPPVREWSRSARWTSRRRDGLCAGPAVMPLVFAMQSPREQRVDGWTWVRRTP